MGCSSIFFPNFTCLFNEYFPKSLKKIL